MNKVLAFESALYAFLKSKYQNVLDTIASTKDLDEATEKQLVTALDEFKKTGTY